jgi:rod shape-determining protein MreB
MGLFDFFTKTIGVDPGSQNLRIIQGGKVFFNERASVSLNKKTSVISGIGSSVRVGPDDVIISPVNYTPGDFHGFEMLLRGAIRADRNPNTIFGSTYKMHFCVPANATEVDKRAYRDSGEHAAAKEVYMIHQNVCSAIGMNILHEVKDFILVDFGASKVEVSVFVNSVPVSSGLLRMGIWKIESLIRNHVLRDYQVQLSDSDVGNSLRSFTGDKSGQSIRIRDLTIPAVEIQDLLDSFFSLVNDEVSTTIERASSHPNLQKALVNGTYFTGGGSSNGYLRQQIRLDNLIASHVSSHPQLDNINGLGKVIANQERFRDYLMT